MPASQFRCKQDLPMPEAHGRGDLPEDGAAGTVLEWLSLYVPSWGTSLMLHAAIILLAVFVGWQTLPAAVKYDVPVGVVTLRQFNVERPRTLPQKLPTAPSRKPLNDKPYVFAAQQLEYPVPGIGELKNALLVGILGIGGERAGLGNLGPSGSPSGPIWPPSDGAKKIVYVVDKSGSMTDSLDLVKMELKRSIMELTKDQEFHVIFYSSGPAVEMPTRRLVAATERNKRLACEFIDGIVAHSQTDPSDALRRAFAVRPEVIHLLTDGEFDREVVGLVRELNPGATVQVNTIGFLYTRNDEVLVEIAAENRGRYKFVSEKDLADLGD